MTKELYIIRGLPGSGKTTFAKKLSIIHYYEADQFFMVDGVYSYNQSRIGEAHIDCQRRVKNAIALGISPIIVSNTFVKRWEMVSYQDMALDADYQITEITMTGPLYPNVHNVPAEVIERMKLNWEV